MGDPEIMHQCRRFAELLGLSEPVTPPVLKGALDNEMYARNLLLTRHHQKYLKYLLAHPPSVDSTGSEMSSISTKALVKNAASALARWAEIGFTAVDDAIYADRLAACAQCPHRTEAPATRGLIYAAAGGAGKGICRLCGCPIDRKARMPTERCPDPHPDRPGVSRWGDHESDPAS